MFVRILCSALALGAVVLAAPHAARADEARLLLLIGRIYALMDAIRTGSDNRSVELAGTARGQYIEVPELALPALPAVGGGLSIAETNLTGGPLHINTFDQNVPGFSVRSWRSPQPRLSPRGFRSAA